jgi:hypothetical protein
MKQRALPSWGLTLVGLLLAGAGVLTLPADRRLGATTRLVFFHGAFVWTAIFLSLAGGLLALLVLGRLGRSDEPVAADRQNLSWILSLATVSWLTVFGLSFPVMLLSWGGVLWTEGRLVMTMLIVFVYLVVWSLAFMWEQPLVSAIGQLVTTAAVTALIVLVPARFHPDNPVFGSGDPRFIAGFLVILGGLLLAALGILRLRWRSRRERDRTTVTVPAA